MLVEFQVAALSISFALRFFCVKRSRFLHVVRHAYGGCISAGLLLDDAALEVFEGKRFRGHERSEPVLAATYAWPHLTKPKESLSKKPAPWLWVLVAYWQSSFQTAISAGSDPSPSGSTTGQPGDFQYSAVKYRQHILHVLEKGAYATCRSRAQSTSSTRLALLRT